MLKFTLFKLTVEVHPSFFLLMGLGIYLGSGIFVAFSALFSFCHELVHGGVAKLLGYHPEKISFGLFGGVLHLRNGFINPIDELAIHLSGPFFNLIMASFFYMILQYKHFFANKFGLVDIDFLETFITPLMLANLVICFFNILPFYPLDGGKVILVYLAFFLGYGVAEKISNFFSLIFSIFLFFLGVYLVQYNPMNSIICALAINLFMVSRQTHSFLFFKVSREMEKDRRGSGTKNRKGTSWKGRQRAERSQMVVYTEDQRAMKVIESYRPWDNNVFTIISDSGVYRGQLTEDELLEGIYHCGIYADFNSLLTFKREKT